MMFFWFSPTPKDKAKKNTLHGVDLDKYNYLGTSKLIYLDILDRPCGSALAFFFSAKTNQYDRIIVMPKQDSMSKYDFNIHEWMVSRGELWKAGQYPLYACINHEPSEYMKEWMDFMYTEQYKWNDTTKYWEKQAAARRANTQNFLGAGTWTKPAETETISNNVIVFSPKNNSPNTTPIT